MDGRPHPSNNAPHTHGGFTTGEWQGDTLVARTTHFKVGDIKRHRGFNSEELPYLAQNLALVPHYLPGKNPFMDELTQNRGIPVEATLGGPETMYPEFRKKLKDAYKMPPPCKTGCGGPPAPPPPPAARRP